MAHFGSARRAGGLGIHALGISRDGEGVKAAKQQKEPPQPDKNEPDPFVVTSTRLIALAGGESQN